MTQTPRKLSDDHLLDNAACCSQDKNMLEGPLRECVQLNVINPLRKELAAMTERAERYREALEKAADTFADAARAFRLFQKFDAARAMSVAEEATRAALAQPQETGA